MSDFSLTATAICSKPDQLTRLEIPERVGPHMSARKADLNLIANAPSGYLDTTHFDTVRFPPPVWAIESYSAAAVDGSLAYTGYRGHQDVLNTVADTLSDFLAIEVSPCRNIILTPGTQAGLFCALSSLVTPGDRVALVDPEYLFSDRILGFLGADVGHVPLRLDEDGPHLDLDALETEFAERDARLMVFSHPNNPTGAVYPDSVIEKIAELAVRYGVTVLVDELYARLLHNGRTFPHLLAQPGMLERTVTLLGPSKTESLSGYRLGVVIAPPELVQRMENVLSITSLRAPAYAQHVLVPWLRDDKEWLADRQKSFTALRESTAESLRRLAWLKLYPQDGTAYLWVDVNALHLPDPVVAEALMTQAAVLVSPGYQFGPSSTGHFRVCYARDETIWDKALNRMVSVLNGLAVKQGMPNSLSL